jgi:hypothetical protein
VVAERVYSVLDRALGAVGAALGILFVSIWVLGFGAGVALMWIDPQGLQVNDPVALSTKLWMTGAFVAGLYLFWWMGVPAKRVEITPAGLRISSLWRKEVVPFEDIEDVDQFTWAHPRMITIRFRRSTRFGRSVRYRPRAWFGLAFIDGEDAEVVEIRDRSMRARPLEPLPR